MGTLFGGVGGTFLEPVGGTIAGGITVREAGAALGAGIGGYIGNQLEDLFGNLNCPFFQSTSNGEDEDSGSGNPEKERPELSN